MLIKVQEVKWRGRRREQDHSKYTIYFRTETAGIVARNKNNIQAYYHHKVKKKQLLRGKNA